MASVFTPLTFLPTEHGLCTFIPFYLKGHQSLWKAEGYGKWLGSQA